VIGVLTGPIGIGKTTLCQRLAELLQGRGLTPGGILAPAVVDSYSNKTGIRLRRVDTGEERLLAVAEGDLGGPRTGCYSFAAEVFEWGMSVTRQALSGDADVVLVDEIGPLELLRNQGLAPLLEELVGIETPHVLVVVREGLLTAIRQRLGRPDLAVFRVDMETRDTLPGRLLEWCLQGSPSPRSG